jgi:hypothetical protein
MVKPSDGVALAIENGEKLLSVDCVDPDYDYDNFYSSGSNILDDDVWKIASPPPCLHDEQRQ